MSDKYTLTEDDRDIFGRWMGQNRPLGWAIDHALADLDAAHQEIAELRAEAATTETACAKLNAQFAEMTRQTAELTARAEKAERDRYEGVRCTAEAMVAERDAAVQRAEKAERELGDSFTAQERDRFVDEVNRQHDECEAKREKAERELALKARARDAAARDLLRGWLTHSEDDSYMARAERDLRTNTRAVLAGTPGGEGAPSEEHRVEAAMDRAGWGGLYRKFDVRRVHDPAGKHRECEYFVLDWRHDPFAVLAARAYADACEAQHADLARDLRAKADECAPREPIAAVAEPAGEPDEARADAKTSETVGEPCGYAPAVAVANAAPASAPKSGDPSGCDAIYDKIDSWHAATTELELHEWLEMTWEEYRRWGESPPALLRGSEERGRAAERRAWINAWPTKLGPRSPEEAAIFFREGARVDAEYQAEVVKNARAAEREEIRLLAMQRAHEVRDSALMTNPAARADELRGFAILIQRRGTKGG